MMNDEEFKELVMICIDKLKDETIFELTKNDEQYQRTTEEEGKADRAYLDLYLEPEQREVCDHFIECRDKQWDEYSTFAPTGPNGFSSRKKRRVTRHRSFS